MKIYKLTLLIVAVILLSLSNAEAKKKHKHKYATAKSKTKTKWSTSTTDEVGPNGTKSMVATEEHGYYVKRTFLPMGAVANSAPLRSPPYLAIPIAWFRCEGDTCLKANTATINGNANGDGFLCDDDCTEPYAPICGRTESELAVFYNKCKLNVAKCRTHGLWTELAYEECKQTYPKEVEYTDKKFKLSPYFKTEVDEKTAESAEILDIALEALNEINDKIEEAEEKAEENEKDADEEKEKEPEKDSEMHKENEKVDKAPKDKKTEKNKEGEKQKENATEHKEHEKENKTPIKEQVNANINDSGNSSDDVATTVLNADKH